MRVRLSAAGDVIGIERNRCFTYFTGATLTNSFNMCATVCTCVRAYACSCPAWACARFKDSNLPPVADSAHRIRRLVKCVDVGIRNDVRKAAADFFLRARTTSVLRPAGITLTVTDEPSSRMAVCATSVTVRQICLQQHPARRRCPNGSGADVVVA